MASINACSRPRAASAWAMTAGTSCAKCPAAKCKKHKRKHHKKKHRAADAKKHKRGAGSVGCCCVEQGVANEL